jgi:hypothetical protein
MRLDFTANELIWLRQALIQAQAVLEPKVRVHTPGAERIWRAYQGLNEKVSSAMKSEPEWVRGAHTIDLPPR